jgi:hypothetical protein
MLVILAVVLVAGIARLVRGGQIGPAPAGPAMPTHPMIGLLPGPFARPRPAEPAICWSGGSFFSHSPAFALADGGVCQSERRAGRSVARLDA